LAAINNTSESSIKRDLNKLKDLGVIKWERYNRLTNWYYLNEELIAEQSEKLLRIWKSRYEVSEDDDVFINKHLDWKIDQNS
jgi:predicted transcriptional regulator